MTTLKCMPSKICPSFSSLSQAMFPTGNRISAKDTVQWRIPTVMFAKPAPGRSISKKHLLTLERKKIQATLKSHVPVYLLFHRSRSDPGLGRRFCLNPETSYPSRFKEMKRLNLVFV
ncbi:hypothetical protein RchiOBHm_Chr2g0150361 [Rosa chinensis]|uniref:Uncharacterized protein n=1 Tax=Rosa chinensis TaxID=74649 RepID=A0A2P6RZV2_ROSCH|nr:hypothetical protein RchiOBHm_Chr2g0150361 [Rosa chinensis]